MACVDYCPSLGVSPAAVPAVGSTTVGAEFSCTACGEAFATSADQRVHCKTERHLYNTKRKLAGLKPISQEAWERKLREARAGVAENKGTSHLKPGKEKKIGGYSGSSAGGSVRPSQAPARLDADGAQPEECSEAQATNSPTLTAASEPPLEPWTPSQSLFDRRKFKTMEDCLAYMQKTYSFFIPDQEYCTDVPGLLTALWKKISEPPHSCLCCNRRFPDLGGVRRHMIDKCHTRIGTEARTRRGLVDEMGSEDLQDFLEDFYDFHASVKEITERIKDPKQKVESLLRYFDEDQDGRLQRGELEKMWVAMYDGSELSDAVFFGACKAAGVDPAVGFDAEELGRLYSEGMADLDKHFQVLEELLSRKKPKKVKQVTEDNEDEPEIEEDNDEEEEDSDPEDGDEDDDEDLEVIECEDEDEFEEVMRVLGLQRVSVQENGDLRLPNGMVATHRDVQYIYRQRGRRLDQEQLALYGGGAQGRKLPVRAQLMLSNAPSGCRIAVSAREQARAGKQIIAVMKRQQKSEMQLGMKRNILQMKKGLGNRTGLGDHTGGVR